MAVVRIHHYSVAPANLAEFLERRPAVIDVLRADHPGPSETRLIKLDDDTYSDTWRWDSPAQMGSAFAAAATVAEIGPAMALTKDATAINGEIIDHR